MFWLMELLMLSKLGVFRSDFVGVSMISWAEDLQLPFLLVENDLIWILVCGVHIWCNFLIFFDNKNLDFYILGLDFLKL